MSEETLPTPNVTGHTRLLALLADPARHSSSPRMHTLAAAKLGLDYVYLAFDVNEDNLGEAVAAMRALDARGFNLSMPNKLKVLEYVDEQSEAVQLIGSCNTVVNEDGKLIAHNTDGVGAMETLRVNGRDPKGCTITIIGAGGAGTAIAVQAGLDGASKINVFNRKDAFWPHAEENVARIAKTGAETSLTDLADADALAASLAESSVLIDATSVGMGKLEGLTNIPDVSILPKDIFVLHIPYNPPVTKLVGDCQAAGIAAVNGKEMLYQQGAAGFKIWTGQDMPLDFIKQHVQF